MNFSTTSSVSSTSCSNSIAESAIEFEHDAEESEDVVEKFKEFLEHVTPEDFAAGDS